MVAVSIPWGKGGAAGGKHVRCLLSPSKEAVGSKPLHAIAFNSVSSPI